MKPLYATPAVLSLVATAALVWIVTSCASQGEAPADPPLDDAGTSDGSTVIPEPDAAGLQACADGRWCAVELPVPGPVMLNGIWGSAPNDVWLVGSPDLAIHWNGAVFSSTRLNTKQTVFGIWGSGAKDIWAFSTGDAFWHSSGEGPIEATWSPFDKDAGAGDAGNAPLWIGAVQAMWGRSATDVWAVGQPGEGGQRTIWHSDGWNSGAPAWVSTASSPGSNPWDVDPSFNAIWGSASGEVWVVGDGGKTRYSKGWKDGTAAFTVVESGTSLPLYAVWGAGAGEVWAAGGGGVVRRFTLRSDDTIAVEEVAFPNRATIRALFGLAANDLWAAGSEGTLAHWNGFEWSLVGIGGDTDAGSTAGSTDDLFALWASSSDDVWAVGRNTLLHRGSKLLPRTMP